MTDTFDFEDGNGPVPAHKHPNGGGVGSQYCDYYYPVEDRK